MKKIRFAMVMAAMLVCVSSVAKAQDPAQQGQRPGAGRGMMMLFNGITLDSATKVKVDSIQAAYREKNAPLREAARGGDQDARSKMMANMQQQTADIRALLTDEQKAVFDKNVEEMRSRMGGGGRPPVTR